MDMMTVNAPVTTPVQTTAGTAQNTGKPAEASFADLLMDLSAAQNTGNVQTGEGATWRDLHCMSTKTQSNTALSGEVQDLFSLLQELSGDDKDVKLQELLKLLEQMQKKMQMQVSEQGSEAAGQQMMALLATLANNLMTDGSTGTDLQTVLQALQTTPLMLQPQSTTFAMGSQDMLTLLSASQQPASEATNAFLEMMAVQAEMASGTGETNGTTQDMALPVTIAEAAHARPAEMADIPVIEVQHDKPAEQPETQFDANVRAAKELLLKDDAKPAGQAKPEADIDALQRQVDAGTYLRNTPLAGATQVEAQEETAQAPAVRTQVEEGILNGIRAGQEQFSIKLKPEGLGELTIKLAKNSEGIMSLSIIAKNAETARSLAGELDLLRQNLQPMKVEVDSILTERQYEMLSQQQNFDGQRQSGQWQRMRGAAYYGDDPLQATDAIAAQTPAPASVSLENSMLDAYI